MGNMQAQSLAAAAREGGDETGFRIGLETAVTIHLRSNCFPPVPYPMIPVAVAAIEAANEGETDRLVDLPDGVTYRDGRASIEAWRIIESLRLDAFIESDGDDDD